MNKEFMLLNDNTIEVTDEEGKEINRGEFENNNVKGILLAENKVEINEIFKIGLNKMLSQSKKIIWLSNNMLKLQPVILVAIPVLTFLFGAITNPSAWLISGISYATSGLYGLIISIAISTVYWSVIKVIYKSETKRIENYLEKTEDIKKISEEELIVQKNNVATEKIEPLVKCSLEEETDAIKMLIAQELIKYHNEHINERGKTRVRKK